MEIVTLYQLYQWDGGEREIPKNVYFKTKYECDKYKKENKHARFMEVTMHVFEDLNEYKDSKSESVKVGALAKLTDLEKLALGIKS